MFIPWPSSQNWDRDQNISNIFRRSGAFQSMNDGEGDPLFSLCVDGLVSNVNMVLKCIKKLKSQHAGQMVLQ